VDLAKLKTELERDEGRKLAAYKDNATPPNWTIGIGHLLGSSPRMSNITDDECDALYAFDARHAESIARSCVSAFDSLGDVRQRALVNMAFNRGNHMKESKTITPAINAAAADGDWEPVELAIAASPWAAQIGDRATRISMMLVQGTI
jgi:GH24 family phage-related lysozyme (muramidase)